MLKRPDTYDSKVFLEFSRLDEENFRSVVHFFEKHQEEVVTMNFEERFIMLLTYSNALYEINAYKRHLRVADDIIELSITHNIQFFNGEDIYLKTLYQKAKSYFHLHEYESAEHVSSELVKMVPNQTSYSKLLNKCLIRQRPNFVKRMLASGVFLYLLSVVFVVINILIVKPSFPEYHWGMETTRISIFVGGIAMLILAMVLHHFSVFNRIRKIKRKAIEKKLKL